MAPGPLPPPPPPPPLSKVRIMARANNMGGGGVAELLDAGTLEQHAVVPVTPSEGGAPCAMRALCLRCAKSRLFFTTGSHGSLRPELCTLQPLLVHQGFFVFLV